MNNLNEIEKATIEEKKVLSSEISNHKKIEILSYGGGNFLQEFLGTVFGSWLFFFYEVEVGLNVWALTLGFTIYAIWNALNSPLIGYYTGKINKLTSRLGRRFPWLLFFTIPWILSLYFLFVPPNVNFNPQTNTTIFFFWLIMFLCLLSLFGTIFGINYSALYPEKFRSDSDRRSATSIIGSISFLAGGLGSILPALIISYGDKSSFEKMVSLAVIIGIIVFILSIPGFREGKEMINRNMLNDGLNSKDSLLTSMKIALKQKNFMIYVILFFLIQLVLMSVGAAFPYAVRYVFKKEAVYTAFLAFLYIIGALVSLPLWSFISKKIMDNKKFLIITGFVLIVAQILFFFTPNINVALISAFLYGFSIAGFWTTLKLQIVGDVFDEIVANTGKRNESTYMGISQFFINFTIVVQSFIFALVHQTTGFVEDAEVQSELAQLGIRLTLSLIPMIFALLAILVFWKCYDLTPSRVEKVRAQLKKLDL